MHHKRIIHASGEDYLEALLVLQNQQGMVRSIDLARYMARSKASISHAVSSLRQGGFLTMDQDKFLHLTFTGKEIAERILEKHCTLSDIFLQIGVDPDTAQADACRIGHVLSDESFHKLKGWAKKKTD